jgi:hypothetical protein
MSDTVEEIKTNLELMSGEGATVYANVMEKITGDDGMQEHIGELFSDDCLSNYVQVPILSLDLDGNYVAPSVGLRNALKIYLDGIKEVTQVVEVVDGSSALVGAEISVKLSVLDGFVRAEIVSQIRSVISRLLKRRDFNSPLYLDSLYEACKQIPGIKYINIAITGPNDLVPSVIDSEGNLVTGENQIINYGSLIIQDAVTGDIL